jgi:hypothetical protein
MRIEQAQDFRRGDLRRASCYGRSASCDMCLVARLCLSLGVHDNVAVSLVVWQPQELSHFFCGMCWPDDGSRDEAVRVV